MSMFSRFFRPAASARVPHQLYGSVVTQSRLPEFFTVTGFPDTVTGRFDVLSLHLFLITRRMTREEGNIAASLNQEVFDAFVVDLDRAMRQLGIGDTSVPKKKKKLVRSYYACIEAFSDALDNEDSATLETRLAARYDLDENGADAKLGGPRSRIMAAYMLRAASHLDAQPLAQFMEGELHWPPAPQNADNETLPRGVEE